MYNNFSKLIFDKLSRKIRQGSKVYSKVNFLKKPFNVSDAKQISVRKNLLNVYGLGPYVTNHLLDTVGLTKGSLNVLLPKKYHQVCYSFFEKKISQYGLALQDKLKKLEKSAVTFKIRNGFVSGLRIAQHLPSKGQRTKTNSRTAKSKRN